MTGEAQAQTQAFAYRDLLLSAYEAFNERDIDFVLLLMHPDVDWPNGMEGGRLRGHDAVRDYWTRQWDVADPRVQPQRFEHLDDGRILVHVHQVVRDLEGNIVLDQMVQHVYLLRDAQILRMDINPHEQH
ncbi:MAG: nuclear transport factor 2 family protein [Candidatus Acidiferrales bacterium]